MSETTLIRVSKKDIKKMRDFCKKLFLKSHPEHNDITITDKFLFTKIVEWYLKGSEFSIKK